MVSSPWQLNVNDHSMCGEQYPILSEGSASKLPGSSSFTFYDSIYLETLNVNIHMVKWPLGGGQGGEQMGWIPCTKKRGTTICSYYHFIVLTWKFSNFLAWWVQFKIWKGFIVWFGTLTFKNKVRKKKPYTPTFLLVYHALYNMSCSLPISLSFCLVGIMAFQTKV